jgi:nuclear pore complex protein Nup98-Nup96
MISDSGSSRADEEEEDEEEDPPSDSSRQSADNQRASARAMTDDQEEEDSGESSRSSIEELLPEHRRGDPSIIPWAQRIGIDRQKMHVMHASLFPGPESAETLKQLNVEKPDRARLTPNGLHRKHSRDSEGEGLRAATQEVSPNGFFVRNQNSRRNSALLLSERPLLMISNPSHSVPLVNMPEWRVLPLS